MNARFFAGPRDGQWTTLEPWATRDIHVPVLTDDGLCCHHYWRYGDRLVYAGACPDAATTTTNEREAGLRRHAGTPAA